MAVPVAHAGHWLWVLYLPPIVIVIASIAKTKLSERRDRNRSKRKKTDQ
jgi:hypothetical protein